MLFDALEQIMNLLYSQVVTIPLENTLSFIYTILTMILNLVTGSGSA